MQYNTCSEVFLVFWPTLGGRGEAKTSFLRKINSKFGFSAPKMCKIAICEIDLEKKGGDGVCVQCLGCVITHAHGKIPPGGNGKFQGYKVVQRVNGRKKLFLKVQLSICS